MLKFYSEKDVRKLVLTLKEEYEDALRRQRQLAERYKEENRTLKARLSVLEGERGRVSSAMVHAVNAGEQIRRNNALEAEQQKKELLLLAEKCRLLSERVQKLCPDEEDSLAFLEFTTLLNTQLGVEEEQSGLNMNEVLAPDYPLDLAKLCKDMGVMEEEE